MLTLLFIKFDVPLKPIYGLVLLGFLYIVCVPGKEFLSFVGMSLCLLSLGLRCNFRLMLLMLGGVVLFLNRPHELALFSMAYFGVSCIGRVSMLRIFSLIILLTIFMFALWEIASPFFGLREGILMEGKWLLNGIDMQFVSSENALIHGLLTPIRMGIVIGSLASILGVVPPDDTAVFFYRYLPLTLRILDFSLIALLTFRFFAGRIHNESLVLVGYYSVILWGISFLGIDEKSRYLIVYSPFLVIALYSRAGFRNCYS
jgi:hypothetical protein